MLALTPFAVGVQWCAQPFQPQARMGVFKLGKMNEPPKAHY
jgi:hypothetical protein